MGYILMAVIFFLTFAGAVYSDTEVTIQTGYHYRLHDDGIDYNGPAAGVLIGYQLPKNWWLEGEYQHSWRIKKEIYSGYEFRSDWKEELFGVGVFKRTEIQSHIAFFAGASFHLAHSRERFRSTTFLPDENDVIREFTEESEGRGPENFPLMAHLGTLITVNDRFLIRLETQILPHPLIVIFPHVGFRTGFTYRF